MIIRFLAVFAALSLCLLPKNAQAVSTNVVIAEVYGGGGNSGSVYKNDFVVLFNLSSAPVNITGWSVQYSSATSTGTNLFQITTPLSGTIAAGGYFLVQEAAGAGGTTSLPTPDSTGNLALGASAGKIALCNTTNALTATNVLTSPSLVDFVGFGTTANSYEGSGPTPAPSNTTSVQRADGGCSDTDNNSIDFTVGNPPTPRNSASPTHLCGGSTAPSITGQPQSRTNNAGTTATFSVSVSGSGVFYSWSKNGANITDANASGLTTATLTVTNVVAANAGDYQVVITNTAGGATSQVATLTVIDPAINTQPANRTNVLGDTANFFVSAGGTATTFQWIKEGTNILDATTATLNVTNLQSSDAGNYQVVVGGFSGFVTSSVATLTLLPTPAARLARWTFNGNFVSSNAPAASESLTTAAASLVGASPSSPAYPAGTFSDPGQVLGVINGGWNTTTYPAANANNKTAGVQFNVSTEGYKNLYLTWEQRNSATGSKYARVQYSPDGFTATTNDATVVAMPTDSVFIVYSADLSAFTSINNNPNFAFRIVSEFESTAIGTTNAAYVGTTSTYGSGGTIRFDIMSIYGNPLGTIVSIPITAQRSGNNLTLTWSDSSLKLQSSSVVTGPFADVVGASSPYTTGIGTNQLFFRLKY